MVTPLMVCSTSVVSQHHVSQVAGRQEWSDQETLLLLEAVEAHGEAWTAVAAHVGTKSGLQCAMRFLQVPSTVHVSVSPQVAVPPGVGGCWPGRGQGVTFGIMCARQFRELQPRLHGSLRGPASALHAAVQLTGPTCFAHVQLPLEDPFFEAVTERAAQLPGATLPPPDAPQGADPQARAPSSAAHAVQCTAMQFVPGLSLRMAKPAQQSS